jgi:hypothetical protein
VLYTDRNEYALTILHVAGEVVRIHSMSRRSYVVVDEFWFWFGFEYLYRIS